MYNKREITNNCNRELKEVFDYLRARRRYSTITNKLLELCPGEHPCDPPPPSVFFEALFAFTLEKHGISLDYEVNVNPDNSTTVDFVFQKKTGKKLCFELASPERSTELKKENEPHPTEVAGLITFNTLLRSNHENPYLRPEAQTIRAQEKLLEKVCKFPPPSNNVFSIIVMDCTSFHEGHFDDEDARMVMFGKTNADWFQEYWDGERLKGLLEQILQKRESEEFRRKISAVIFVRERRIGFLYQSYLVINSLRSKRHRLQLENKLKRYCLYNILEEISLPSIAPTGGSIL
jgi:hypothetical protein